MYLSLFKDKTVILYSSITIIISLVAFLYFSAFVGLALLLSSIFGLITPVLLFSEHHHIPNLFGLFTRPSHSGATRELPRSCSVCGGDECNRQHPSAFSSISAHAHINFTVPQSIDDALEELFNLVLDHHIYSWYKEISVHDQLADEIRYLIRYASASIAARLTKVDLTAIIMERLIPSGLSHLDAYLEGSRRVRGYSSIEASVLQYLESEKSLHAAVVSREEECNYLRKLVASLFPFLVPMTYQESGLGRIFLQELLGPFLILKGIDLLADPDIVNLLFLLLFDEDVASPTPPSEQEPNVLLLKSFTSLNTHPRNSVLGSNLSSILKDQTLLYLFHTFLKTEGAINILSFCLAVEDFNHHILDPDLTPEQLKTLHKEALELYHTYMVATAVDRLNFQPEIVAQIREIVHGDVNDIVKLRTTRPLFQAYEHAYNLLEKEYLPLFINSNAYFNHICGPRSSQNVQKNSNRDGPSSLLGARVGKVVVQRFGSGLVCLGRQMTLKPCVISGDQDPYSSDVDEGSDITAYMMTDEVGTARTALESLSHPFRDLSAWRVSIPCVEESLDVAGKMEFVFIVDVTRIDVQGDNPEEMQWKVERRYHEFYVLEAKLTEFHGEFGDNVLPPRRSFFSSKGTSFMHSRRQVFEEFLQKLLQKPCLKNSQLLFLFFKSKDEFTASYLPDVSLSRLLKEVPRKLIKERGQNLDSFLSSFVASTSYHPYKPANLDLEGAFAFDEPKVDLSFPEDVAKSLLEGVFRDNARSLLTPPAASNRYCSSGSNAYPTTATTTTTTSAINTSRPTVFPLGVSGFVDMILFLAVRLYGISSNCLRWAMCFKVVAGNTADAAVTWFLRQKLKQSLETPRIVMLIHSIRDALFVDPPSTRTEEDFLARERDIREAVINILPRWVRNVVFTSDLYLEGANTLVNLFQHPVLNKQLSYVLLDIVLEELFPEFRDGYEQESKFLSSLNQDKTSS